MDNKIKSVVFTPIGIVRSPFKNLEGMPIQPVGARNIKGQIWIKKEYEEGLKDLEGFSHIILIYHFHLSKGHLLKVKPFMDNNEHGIFATRAPKRPNPVGLSVVSIDKIEKNIIYISNVDVVDGTPLLDIKPYVPYLDKLDDEKLKLGWLEDRYGEALNKRSDKRFLQKE